MNQAWQEFLAQQGAQLLEGTVKHFGDLPAELLAARDDTILCDLDQFGTLKAAGEEAQSFLQNLLSCDVKLITPAHASLGSFNSPKGRMQASFLIWQQAGDYYLQLPRSLTPAMHKRLSMYVLRSKVKVTDASEELVSLGLSGKRAAELLQQHYGSVPTKQWETAQHGDCVVMRLGEQRFQISCPAAQAPALWTVLSKGARAAGSGCWDWLNVRSGIPVITALTQEQFVLQMVNFDALGGVSFKKGCYPGQEIVARTQHIGKIKRRMFLAHVESAAQAGDELFSAEMAGQPSGMVVNAAMAPGGGYDVLAMLQISSMENQTVHLKALEGPALKFQQLPYALPAQTD